MNKEDTNSKSFKLKAVEAEYSDVGRSIARISNSIMEELNISTGDIIKIKGKRGTAAVAWRSRLADEGKKLIRMDSIIRRNAGVGLEDNVEVSRCDAKRAQTLTLAPVDQVRIRGNLKQYFKQILLNKPALTGDLLLIDLMGQKIPFVVAQTSPKGAVYITAETKFKVSEKPMKPGDADIPTISYEDIGGLREEIKKIREMVELPLRHPQLFQKLGIDPPKGVLLYGPPGTGKTLLARAVASESGAYFITINGPEIMSKYYGESERQVREIFEDASKNSPAIIFIDEIDAIATKREETRGEVERRVVSQLLTMMDGLKGRGQVVVIAATNIPDSIDPALRRPGRFDREIEIGVPDRKGRTDILQIHTRGMPLSQDVEISKLVEFTRGFTGADLSMLTKEAAMKALRRVLPEVVKETGKVPDEIPMEIFEKLIVTLDDFRNALNEIEPSGMRDVIIEIPRVKWDDVGGLVEVKEELKESIEWPLNYPESYSQMGIEPPKGVLLYGPPGTGKTMLAKAVANEANANFIAVKGPEIFSKWVGESEKAIRKIFRKARQVTPAIIFFDEIDSLASKRGSDASSGAADKVMNQILTELDGIENLRGVVVLAATNRIDLIDSALTRPGRLDKSIVVPMPNKEARLAIFKVHTSKVPLLKGVDFNELARKTEGYSGADIAAISREAVMDVMRDSMIQLNTFKKDVELVVKGITTIEELAKKYKDHPQVIDFLSKHKSRKRELRKASLDLSPTLFKKAVSHQHFMEALLHIKASLSEKDRKFYEDLKK
ncbi:MAG: CDC48 family AAA ATPase [Candidatus Altiarchaeota archaeon]|nr:CDC48 family AAA ATPase [Candidatus Altiarchaeota archaeon]